MSHESPVNATDTFVTRYLPVILAGIAIVFTALQYFHVEPIKRETLILTALSIQSKPDIKLANNKPIFSNVAVAKFRIKNVGEHRADITIHVLGGLASIAVDGKDLAEEDYRLPSIVIEKDSAVIVRLEKLKSPSYIQEQALDNVWREHGPNIEAFLSSQKTPIFNFGGSNSIGWSSNCNLSFNDAQEELFNSHEVGFGLNVSDDNGLSRTCYIKID